MLSSKDSIMSESDPQVDRWTAFVFAQSNPRGPGMGNIPALLRRVAESVERLGDVQVLDLVFHNEITEEGDDWPNLTVYYRRPELSNTEA
jgi:hypothetical protein